jgi:hypothetical protein
MIPTTKLIADLHRQVITHAGRTKTPPGLRTPAGFVIPNPQAKRNLQFHYKNVDYENHSYHFYNPVCGRHYKCSPKAGSSKDSEPSFPLMEKL